MDADLKHLDVAQSPVSKPWRSARWWAWRFVRLVLVIYLSIMLSLFFVQSAIIFPGQDSQGHPWAVVRPPAGTELVRLKTASGETIFAVFGPALTPEGASHPDSASRPTLLFFYGNGEHLGSTCQGLLDDFRRLGANVLIPEYVGYGMSSGSASEAGCYETADAAYEHLLSRPDVDPSKIVVSGWSLGAGPAVDLAARKPVARLAILSAFTSVADMARLTYPFIPGVAWLLKHRFDSQAKIAKVRCPILIGHGARDSIIPFEMSEQLAAASGGPVTHLRVERAGHNDLFSTGGEQVFDALRVFLDEV